MKIKENWTRGWIETADYVKCIGHSSSALATTFIKHLTTTGNGFDKP